MMDWGIPDWRDPDSYGETDNWSGARWAWEFIRRRADYRSDAQKIIAMDVRDPEWRRVWGEFFNKYGYIDCLYPWVSEQPEDKLLRWPREGIGWNSKAGGFWSTLKSGEIQVTFSLDLPIAEQVEAAKRVLQEQQIERHGKKLQTREQRDKWLRYLRVLDAPDNISHEEIKKVLGKYLRDEPQVGRDIRKAAIATQAKF